MPPADSRTTPALRGVRDLALEPLEEASRAQAVAQRLEHAIALGIIPAGSALPPESELAAQMNVSLMTLRNSLAALRGRGLIRTKRGRQGGNFVVHTLSSDDQPLRQRLLALDIDTIRDSRDYYTAISGKSAELAAVRARGRQLDRLAEAAEAVRSAKGAPEVVRCDSRFHLELAASTRSASLTRAELAAQNEIASLLWIPGLECQSTAQCANEHLVIVAAIEQRDRAAARLAAEGHLGDSMNRLIELRMSLTEETG